jgi:hypothetical protein
MNISKINQIQKHYIKRRLFSSIISKNQPSFSIKKKTFQNENVDHRFYEKRIFFFCNVNKAKPEEDKKDEKSKVETEAEEDGQAGNDKENKAKFKTSRIIWNYICKIWNYTLSIGFFLFLYNYYLYKIQKKEEYMKSPYYVMYFHKTILLFKGTKDYVKQVSLYNIIYYIILRACSFHSIINSSQTHSKDKRRL